jgi:DNA gyrase/topoisomerase IV subunit A
VSDDRQNLLARREIVVAYIEVLDRLAELVDLCSTVTGDTQELRTAVEEAFGLNPVAADAVLSMQVRRFTPNEREKLRNEFADLEQRLQRMTGA